MFKNIKESYEENIRRTPWADDETKEAILEKIQSVTAFIGFDNSLLQSKTINREYKKIDIEPGNYYKLLATLYRQKRKKELFKLFTTNDFQQRPQHNPAELTGSYYKREYNQVVITITDIEFTFYDLGLEVLHYATIGCSLAHEVGHSIDEIGSLYDADGDMNYCLSDTSAEAFDKIVQCFKLYSNAFNQGQKSAQGNGVISVDKNMADWQGFNMAMMAYQKYVEKHGDEPKLTEMFSDLRPEQLFTLAYAHQSCIEAKFKYTINSPTCSSQIPERTRVNIILRNSSQFSDAWRCAADEPMNPSKKCELWFWRQEDSDST